MRQGCVLLWAAVGDLDVEVANLPSWTAKEKEEKKNEMTHSEHLSGCELSCDALRPESDDMVWCLSIRVR